ncbi:UMP-CMP kinase, putative [Hepatocystis sp. ex Piliocolobus tephrosceles]|nr:UMP-CMP kinase, putative [Hepatocystis sp. ex Piliocolobus tephrosceles]
MNINKIYVIICFIALVNASFFFVENIKYSKLVRENKFYLSSTNVYYKRSYHFKNTTERYIIRRKLNNRFKNTFIFSTNQNFIKIKLEQQFLTNNNFTMSKNQPFVVGKNKSRKNMHKIKYVDKRIFMLGGPGSGKGTQCKLIQEKFDFIHISAGDCLREYLSQCEKNEVDNKYQPIVSYCIDNGKIVPVDITLKLMKKKLQVEIDKIKQKEKNSKNSDTSNISNISDEQEEGEKKSFSFNVLNEAVNINNINIEEYNNKLKYTNHIYENEEVLKILKKNKCNHKAKYKFIIDGFPRNYDNFNGWMNIIGNYAYVHLCLFLYCNEEVMIERCMNRGLVSGRTDDNLATLKKRFDTHNKGCIPIINLFLSENKCIFINANKNINDVWNDIQFVFTNI